MKKSLLSCRVRVIWNVVPITTKNQLADLLTKSLASEDFEGLRKGMVI